MISPIDQMVNSTVGHTPGAANNEPNSVTYNREHWILIGTLLSPIFWTLAILSTNPFFGISFFGSGRGYADMTSAILHHGSRNALYLAGFSAFIIFFLRGTFDQFPTSYFQLKDWLRHSPGSRRLFAVIGVFLVLATVKWVSTEIPGQAYSLSKGISIDTLFQSGQIALNAVRLFWPCVAFLLIRSHAARLSYKDREYRNVRSGEPSTDSMTVTKTSPSSRNYWERRMLWMGAGWLAISAVNLLCNTLLSSLIKFLQRSGQMTRAFSSIQYLTFTVSLAALPLVLMSVFLLHPRFRPLQAWLREKVVSACWLCTGLVFILGGWNWFTSIAEIRTQFWAVQPQAVWNFILSFWTLVLALLLTLSVSRRMKYLASIR